jgi:hypothetical protein
MQTYDKCYAVILLITVMIIAVLVYFITATGMKTTLGKAFVSVVILFTVSLHVIFYALTTLPQKALKYEETNLYVSPVKKTHYSPRKRNGERDSCLMVPASAVHKVREFSAYFTKFIGGEHKEDIKSD